MVHFVCLTSGFLAAFDVFVYVSPLIFLHRLLKYLTIFLFKHQTMHYNWDSLPTIRPAYNLTQGTNTKGNKMQALKPSCGYSKPPPPSDWLAWRSWLHEFRLPTLAWYTDSLYQFLCVGSLLFCNTLLSRLQYKKIKCLSSAWHIVQHS